MDAKDKRPRYLLPEVAINRGDHHNQPLEDLYRVHSMVVHTAVRNDEAMEWKTSLLYL